MFVLIIEKEDIHLLQQYIDRFHLIIRAHILHVQCLLKVKEGLS